MLLSVLSHCNSINDSADLAGLDRQRGSQRRAVENDIGVSIAEVGESS